MTKWSRIISFLVIVVVSFAFIAVTVTDVADDIILGLDLQGGFELLYEVTPIQEGQEMSADLLNHTIAALQQRVDVIGVSEPEFRPEGDDRIRVRLAGVDDQDQARRMLSTEANLSFRDTDDNFLMGGDVLQEGSAGVNFHEQTGRPIVTMEFADPALAREVTTDLLGQTMVIWLDYEEELSYAEEREREQAGDVPQYISAATVRDVLSTNGMIQSPHWTYDEAQELADLLNAGSLPVEMEEITARSVGAALGEDAMSTTVIAGLIGSVLVLAYMLVFYRLPGVVASITLILYVYLILLVFNWMQATLTLPGIAALVLGIGMAVDANILTYERIKEEIRSGKTIRSSFKAGSRRAFRTIMDANITTLIAAGVLFSIGEGAIQGFAVMLMISIVLSIITAVWGARLLLKLLITSRLFDRKPRLFGVKEGDIHEL